MFSIAVIDKESKIANRSLDTVLPLEQSRGTARNGCPSGQLALWD
jgi:hypothetical protein